MTNPSDSWYEQHAHHREPAGDCPWCPPLALHRQSLADGPGVVPPAGLDPDQIIRAYAMREARLLTAESPKEAALIIRVARRNDGTVLDVAAMIAAYIRDGSRP